jgi:YVTN family beta-propeller protein
VHGVIANSQSGMVFATSTRTNTLAEIDGKRLRVTVRIPAGHDPDGLAYDPDDKRVFVSDETGRTVTVVDARTSKRIVTIPVGGSESGVVSTFVRSFESWRYGKKRAVDFR